MGNQLSLDNNENSIIKSLYSMDEHELKKLHTNINYRNINKNHILLLKRIKNIQISIKDSIPYNKHNKVNHFLESVEYNIMTSNKNAQTNVSYVNKEEEMEKQFLRELELKKQQFYKSQQNRRKQYEQEIKTFKLSDVDARKLFKLGTQFTMDELKMSYRNLARKFHPDRAGGNNQKFQVITKAYMTIMEELKMKEQDKQINDLRQGSRDFFENQKNDNKQNLKMSKGKFDLQLFNKIYEENRLHDVTDNGYSEWLKKANVEEVQKPNEKLFSKKFNVNVFNNVFDEQAKQNKEVTKFKEPEALGFGNFSNSNSMLGVDKVDNYSDTGYSDLFEAHSNTNLVNSQGYSKKDFKMKTMEEIQAERSEIGNLSMAEIREIESNKITKKKEEEKRTNNIKKKDDFMFKRYDELNKQMLNSSFFR